MNTFNIGAKVRVSSKAPDVIKLMLRGEGKVIQAGWLPGQYEVVFGDVHTVADASLLELVGAPKFDLQHIVNVRGADGEFRIIGRKHTAAAGYLYSLSGGKCVMAMVPESDLSLAVLWAHKIGDRVRWQDLEYTVNGRYVREGAEYYVIGRCGASIPGVAAAALLPVADDARPRVDLRGGLIEDVAHRIAFEFNEKPARCREVAELIVAMVAKGVADELAR